MSYFVQNATGLVLNDVIDPGFSSHIVMQQYLDNISVDDSNATILLMELCFIRDNIFYVPELSKGNTVDLITYVLSNVIFFAFFCVFFCFFAFLLFLCVTFSIIVAFILS